MGKELKNTFLEAGFSDFRVGGLSASSGLPKTLPSFTASYWTGSTRPMSSKPPRSTDLRPTSSSTRGNRISTTGETPLVHAADSPLARL